MRRRILGAVASAAASPFLMMFFLTWVDLVVQGDGQPIWGRGGFVNIPLFGILALLLLWAPLLLLAAIAFVLGSILQRAGFRSAMTCAASGAPIGLVFLFLLATSGPPEPFSTFDWLALLSGAASGTVCGWIYWRIAIGRTPANGHAIEAE